MTVGWTSLQTCLPLAVTLPVPIVVCAVLSVAVARADDDIVVEEAIGGEQPRIQAFDATRAAAQSAQLVRQYEHQVFQSLNATRRSPAPPGNKTPTVRERVTASVEEWLRRIDASCGLTEQQRSRLRAAADDEIETIVAHVEDDIARYKAVQFEGRDQQFWQKTYLEVAEDAGRAREMLARTFDGDSLLFKVLPTTLSAEQHERLRADFAARRAGRWAAAVAGAMESLDQVLGLTSEQSRGLEQALLARQPALRIYPPLPEHAHALMMLVCIELAGMSEDELRAFVADRQWSVLEALRHRGELTLQASMKQGWYEP